MSLRKQSPREPRVAIAVGGLAGWQARKLRELAATQLAELTVGDMARAAGLSPSHFSRAFKISFGLPPRDWLLECRLEEARRRLEETSDTVEHIAVDLGYSSGSQLSRAFRAHYGLPPQAHRRA